MQWRISRFSLRNIGISLGILCAFIAIQVPTHVAAVTSAVNPGTASGLEISPATVELSGEKGKTYVIKLKLHNVIDGPLTYLPSVEDFGAKDESGTPKILPIGDLPPTASMHDWVSPAIGPVMLNAHEIRQISITIVIPVNAEAGGHYGVINFTSSDPAVNGNAVGVKASTGLLVLAKVAGATKEVLSVASMTTEQNRKQNSVFETSPITFVTRLKNQGNIHLKPSGTIEVKDMFGGIISLLKVNNPPGNVLPDSIRRFETTLNKDWMIGRYVATLTIGYGTTGQVVTEQISFWVIPYKVLLTALAVLVTVGFVVRQLLKGYNRRIIHKYKQSNEKQTKKPKKH